MIAVAKHTSLRTLVTLALALTMALASGAFASAAHAGTNEQHGPCISSYNFADTASNYLYASTVWNQHFPEPCFQVQVSIRQGGCTGTVLSSEQGWMTVSTSYTFDSKYWVNPCSLHQGQGGMLETHYLPFNF